MPKRDFSEKSQTPESIAAALRARLRGIADVRGRREGSGYRVTAGAGYSQVSDTAAVAGYRLTRGYVVAWCNGAAEGAGWFLRVEEAREGFDYALRLVRAGTTAELEHRQGLTPLSDAV
jgi:hypothetical protein